MAIETLGAALGRSIDSWRMGPSRDSPMRNCSSASSPGTMPSAFEALVATSRADGPGRLPGHLEGSERRRGRVSGNVPHPRQEIEYISAAT